VAPMALQQGTVQCGPIQVHHTFGGRGSPLLLIHGLGSAGYMEWRFNLRRLATRHMVYAPDLPGFGRSDKPASARYSLAFFARTLVRYMQELKLRSAAVMGTSLGGGVALELATRHPRRVRKLVLVNSVGLGRPKLQPHYPLLALPGIGELGMRAVQRGLRVAPPLLVRRVAARMAAADADVDRLLDDSYLDQLRELFEAEGYPEAYLATVRSLLSLRALASTFDASTRLPRVSIPVLLIWGANDPIFPVENATSAHRLLPDSKLIVLEGAGHTPQAERPDQFNRAVLDFLG
jgi:pimeloyl-ACP methyl ester carboxylesterase